jgi:hypothetical protein
MTMLHTWKGKAGAAVAAGALLLVGCGTRELPDMRAQLGAAGAAAAPMAVACEPGQRAIVRPVTQNGVTMSQVECTTVTQAPGLGYAAPVANGFQPVAYVPQGGVMSPTYAYERPAVYEGARPIPAVYTPRAEAPRRVVTQSETRYARRPVRSVTKSAVIIGSSAGAGAGLGAVIGGKKGAAIGALLGGGGATLRDQVTRRKQ